LKANRTRYIGCSVVLASATRGTPYRERAVKLVGGNFRAHSSVRAQIRRFRDRRNIIYAKVIGDLCDGDCSVMVGKTPLDWKTCFTVGGTNSPMDNAWAEQLFDCVLNAVGIKPYNEFTRKTAESFCMEAGRATRYNRMMLCKALMELGKEGRSFDFTDSKAKKLYTKLKNVVPTSHLQKEEVESMSYSVAHAASSGIDAVYYTSEDSFDDVDTRAKVEKAIKEVLRLAPQDCPEVLHISASWY